MDRRQVLFLLFAGAGALIAPAAGAAPAFSIRSIYKQGWKTCNRILGTPRSRGDNHSFQEYSIRAGGVYVLFENDRAIEIKFVLRKPVKRSEDALGLIGLAAGKKPASYSDTFMRRWNNLSGCGQVTVTSLDGRLWDSVEVRVRPAPNPLPPKKKDAKKPAPPKKK